MRTILVPVNFTANSANAARYAVDLALAIDADIHLLYVFELTVSVSEAPMPASVFEELQARGLEMLETLTKELSGRSHNRVRVTTAMMNDRVDRGIEEYCSENSPFLVVMGAADDSLPNILAGSHTIKAIRHLRYPLLVIPAHARFQPVHKIVIACDHEDIYGGIPDALPFLKEISGILNAQLEVVHVLTDGDSSEAGESHDYNVWKQEIQAFGPRLHFIRRPTAEEGVTDYLAKNPADWLMVLPKSHSMLEFHRSRAKQIVLRGAIPVISVHE